MRIACTQYKGISVPHLGVVPGAEGGGREVKSVILMGRCKMLASGNHKSK